MERKNVFPSSNKVEGLRSGTPVPLFQILMPNQSKVIQQYKATTPGGECSTHPDLEIKEEDLVDNHRTLRWFCCTLCDFKADCNELLKRHFKYFHKITNVAFVNQLLLRSEGDKHSKEAASAVAHRPSDVPDAVAPDSSSNSINVSSSGVPEEENRTCPICSHNFHSFLAYSHHKEEAHMVIHPSREHRFGCPWCAFTHQMKSITWSHVVEHFEDVKKCPHCGLPNTQYSDLEEHIRTEHPEMCLEERLPNTAEVVSMPYIPELAIDLKQEVFETKHDESPSRLASQNGTSSGGEANPFPLLGSRKSKTANQAKESISPLKEVMMGNSDDESGHPLLGFVLESDCNDLSPLLENTDDEDLSSEPFHSFLPDSHNASKVAEPERSFQGPKRKLTITSGDTLESQLDRCGSINTNCDYRTIDEKRLKLNHQTPQEEGDSFERNWSPKRSSHNKSQVGNLASEEPRNEKASLSSHDCEFCNQAFKTSLHLLNHKEEHHRHFVPAEDKNFECPECEEQFEEEEQMWAHFRFTHNESRLPWKCPQCHHKGPDFDELRLHFERCHSELELNHFLNANKQRNGSNRIKSSFSNRKTRSISHGQTKPESKLDQQSGEKGRIKFKLEVQKMLHETQPLMYKCSECDYTTRLQTKLRKHLRTHLAQSELFVHVCPFCDQTFPSFELLFKHKLKAHIIRDPSDSSIFKCPKCEKSFKYTHRVWRHLRLHYKERFIIKCAECDYSSLIIEAVKNHYLKYHSKQQLEAFLTKRKLEQNQMIHVVRTKCKLLGKEKKEGSRYLESSQRSSLFRNEKKKSLCNRRTESLRNYNMKSPLRNRKTRSLIKQSTKSLLGNRERKFPLSDGDKNSPHSYGKSNSSLSKKETNSPLSDVEANSPISDREMNSPLSDSQKNSPFTHKEMHSSFSNEETESLTNGEKRGMFACRSCSYRSNEPLKLKFHEMLHEEQPQLNKCSKCDLTTPSVTQLRNHFVSHLSPSEFIVHSCPFCDQTFRSSSMLLKHKEEVHLTRDPSDKSKLKCPECEKLFKHKHHVWFHLRSHFESRFLIKCAECNYNSLRFFDVKRHYISYHSKEQLEEFLAKRNLEQSQKILIVKTDQALLGKKEKTEKRSEKNYSLCNGKIESPLSIGATKKNLNDIKAESLSNETKLNFRNGKSIIFRNKKTRSITINKETKPPICHEETKPPICHEETNFALSDGELNSPLLDREANSPLSYREMNSPPGDSQINSPLSDSQKNLHLKSREIHFSFNNEETESLGNRKKSGMLACRSCTYRTIDALRFHVHKMLHEKQPLLIKCSECDFTSRFRWELRKHFLSHLSQSEIILHLCKFCDKTFQDSLMLVKHKEDVHLSRYPSDKSKFKCPKCEKVFKDKHHVWYHLKAHFGSRFLIKCAECDYSNLRIGMVKKHYSKHHSKEQLEEFVALRKLEKSQAILIAKTRPNPKLLRKKEKIKKRSEKNVSLCNIKTKSPLSIAATKKNLHSDQKAKSPLNDREANSPLGDREMNSPLSDSQKNLHLKSSKILFSFSNLERESLRNRKKRGMFACRSCSYRSNEPLKLKFHEMLHEEQPQLNKCSECDFTTPSVTELRNHFVSHLSPSEFIVHSCPFCDQTFQSSSMLLKHKEEVHLTRDPSDNSKLKCPECEKLFKHKHHVWFHLRSHFESRFLIKCAECNYNSLRFFDVKRHYISYHSKEQLEEFLAKRNLEQSQNILIVKTDQALLGKKEKTEKRSEKNVSLHSLKTKSPLSKRKTKNEKTESSLTDEKTKSPLSNGETKNEKTESSFTDEKTKSPRSYEQTKPKENLDQPSKAKRLTCPSCSFCTEDHLELEVHKLGHEKQTLLNKCPECDFTTVSEKHLRKHMCTHLGKSEFIAHVCPFCDQNFLTYTLLNKHKQEAHVIRDPSDSSLFICTDCQKPFRRMQDLWAHLRSHFESKFIIKCAECGFSHLILHQVKKHYFQYHSKQQLEAFLVKRKLEQNQKMFPIVKMDPELLKEKKLEAKENTKYSCSFCPYVSYRLSHLKSHMDVHMNNTYSCSMCPFVSKSKTSLKCHERKHNPVKQYKCSECDYESSLMLNFNNHVLNHMGVKKFKCDQCPYASNTKRNISRHQVVHLRKTDFSCRLCDYQTSWNNELKLHMLEHQI